MKYYLLLITLVIFSGLNFAQSGYDSALESIKKNDFKNAINIADKLFNADSSDVALKILVDVTSKDTTNKQAYELLGDVYNKMKVYVLAIDNYNKAERLDTLDAKLKFKIAQVFEKQQQYTDAANAYLQVITRDSTYSQAYLNLGELLYYAKQYPNAAFYLSRYLKFDQKDYKVYLYAANSFYLMQNFSNAARVALEGLQNFPDKIELKKIAGLSLVVDKKYDDALKLINTIPDSVFSAKEYSQIGVELQAGTQDSLAIIFMQKALAKDSSLVNLYESIANMYLTLGKYDEAVPYYDKKIQADSTSVSAHVNKALCQIQLKDYNGARISLLQAIQIKGDYIPSIVWLARDYRYMDSLSAASDAYQKMIKQTTGNEEKYKTELSEAYGFFGYTDLLKKRYKSAIDNLKSSITYAPDNWQYHLWLAQAYALSGSKNEAVKEYKQVLELDPKNADARRGLKLIGL